MSHLHEELRLQIISDPYYISLARSFVQSIGRRAEMSFSEIGDMKIVIGELLSNIILHSYTNDNTGPIIIRSVIEDERLRFFVRDFGNRVDLKKFQSRDLKEYREGGLGLFLIKELSDFLNFDRSKEVGTEVEVIFKI